MLVRYQHFFTRRSPSSGNDTLFCARNDTLPTVVLGKEVSNRSRELDGKACEMSTLLWYVSHTGEYLVESGLTIIGIC